MQDVLLPCFLGTSCIAQLFGCFIAIFSKRYRFLWYRIEERSGRAPMLFYSIMPSIMGLLCIALASYYTWDDWNKLASFLLQNSAVVFCNYIAISLFYNYIAIVVKWKWTKKCNERSGIGLFPLKGLCTCVPAPRMGWPFEGIPLQRVVLCRHIY